MSLNYIISRPWEQFYAVDAHAVHEPKPGPKQCMGRADRQLEAHGNRCRLSSSLQPRPRLALLQQSVPHICMQRDRLCAVQHARLL
jgi:hypothetical protein